MDHLMKNFYPIWHSASHGPACSAKELAALYASHLSISDTPIDVIHFVDEENLAARLRLLGWTDIADSIAPADEPLSPEDETFLRFSTYEERISHGWRIEGDSADRDRVDKEFSQ